MKTKSLFFDKTGTLALGQPRLIDIVSMDVKYTKEELLSIAAAVEKHSFHPVARALVAEWEAGDRKIPGGLGF